MEASEVVKWYADDKHMYKSSKYKPVEAHKDGTKRLKSEISLMKTRPPVPSDGLQNSCSGHV